jgi:hypothetical protein
MKQNFIQKFFFTFEMFQMGVWDLKNKRRTNISRTFVKEKEGHAG